MDRYQDMEIQYDLFLPAILLNNCRWFPFLLVKIPWRVQAPMQVPVTGVWTSRVWMKTIEGRHLRWWDFRNFCVTVSMNGMMVRWYGPNMFFLSGYAGHVLHGADRFLFFFYLTLKSAYWGILVQKNIVKFCRKWMWLWNQVSFPEHGNNRMNGAWLKHILNHWNFTLVHRRLPPWSTQLPSERLLRQWSILARLWPCYIVRAIISQQDFRKLKFSKHMVELGCITIQIQILVFTSGDSIGDSIEEDLPSFTVTLLYEPSTLQHFEACL